MSLPVYSNILNYLAPTHPALHSSSSAPEIDEENYGKYRLPLPPLPPTALQLRAAGGPEMMIASSFLGVDPTPSEHQARCGMKGRTAHLHGTPVGLIQQAIMYYYGVGVVPSRMFAVPHSHSSPRQNWEA